MASLFGIDAPGTSPEDLERRIAKLQKINAALMQRVERSMDQQGNAYSLFQTAIALESQVRQRTEELTSALARLERTNDELSAARDTSERANRFKTRFFTAVGHDLLQPLHAARLSASALAEANGSASQRAIAERIEHALTTIEQLLKSILDISKLEAGVVTPACRSVALDEMFASLVVDLEPQARAKGLALTWRRNGLTVNSDPLMLRRILQNLMANAVQYTDKGCVRLLGRPRGEMVRIEVWDTGPGIGEADRETIFEEFQRGAATDRPTVGGFGLGLSIVQRMAEAAAKVRAAAVTVAVRDSHLGEELVPAGAYIGVIDHQVLVQAPTLSQAVNGLLQAIVRSEDELVSLYYGEGVPADEAQQIVEQVGLPQAEIQLYYGGQPHYLFLVSVE